MKFSLSSKLMMLAVALFLTASVFASDVHRASLQTLDTVQVNGKALPAGEYQVKWEGNGPDVEVSIVKGKKVLATTPARVVDLSQKQSNDAALLQTNADGSRSLSQIRFAGKKFALAVGGEPAEAEMKSGQSSK